MSKFRVHFESSAAVGIEVEVEAETEEQAEKMAKAKFLKGELRLSDIVDSLMTVDENAIDGWNGAEGSGLPVTHATVALDEAGFEVVDCFRPEDI